MKKFKIVDFTDNLYVELDEDPDTIQFEFNGEVWRAYAWRATYDNFGEATYHCHFIREQEYKDKTN